MDEIEKIKKILCAYRDDQCPKDNPDCSVDISQDECDTCYVTQIRDLFPKDDDDGLLSWEGIRIVLQEQDKKGVWDPMFRLEAVVKYQKFLTINKLRQAVHDSREGKELDLSEEAFEVFNMIKNEGLNEAVKVEMDENGNDCGDLCKSCEKDIRADEREKIIFGKKKDISQLQGWGWDA